MINGGFRRLYKGETGFKLKVRATPTGDGVLRTDGTHPETERWYNWSSFGKHLN